MRLAKTLSEKIGDFECEHDADLDADALLEAGVPLPSRNLYVLRYIREDFIGFKWSLDQLIDLEAGDLPGEPSKAGPEPGADATPAPPSADGFDAFMAWCRSRNPAFAAYRDAMTDAERDRDTRFRRRQWAYRSAPVYHDAFAISQLAQELHERMDAFTGKYDGSEGVAALAALGVPMPDHYEAANPPVVEFAEVRKQIAKRVGKVRRLAAALRPEMPLEPYTPVDRRDERAAA